MCYKPLFRHSHRYYYVSGYGAYNDVYIEIVWGKFREFIVVVFGLSGLRWFARQLIGYEAIATLQQGLE